MTSKEAAEHLIAKGTIKWKDECDLVESFLDACFVQVKADETRRCADYVRGDQDLNWLADDLLTTGGLEPL